MFRHIVNWPYYNALKKLRDKKTRNQSQIAKLFGMEDSRVVHLVRSWQQEGLIERKKGQRESEIKISNLGLNTINKLEEAEDTYNKEPYGKSPVKTMEEKENPWVNREIQTTEKGNTKDKVGNQNKSKEKKNE